jgi:hypothetical protein
LAFSSAIAGRSRSSRKVWLCSGVGDCPHHAQTLGRSIHAGVTGTATAWSAA